MNAAYVLLALPLGGFLVLVWLGRRLGEPAAGWLATLVAAGSFVAAVVTWLSLLSKPDSSRLVIKQIFTWMPVAGLHVNFALQIDPLSVTMALFVTGVGTLIHLYSIGYMHGDERFPRFFVLLNLFLFSMLCLVMADNFLFSFLGWEGVGFCSYQLVSFWFERDRPPAAGKKAFVTSRVGDFGFSLGIYAVFVIFGSLDFGAVFGAASKNVGTTMDFLGWQVDSLTLACILLFIGAMGKSAQIPLHTWLPDAMEGPTPVSALIHAATMVTAGVFMVARLSPLFEYAPTALAVVGVIGGTTAMFAASIGMVQPDIKKVVAYSTCSQLGYMFAAAGVSAYGAAIFHLFTHAFFKGLLFLCCGSVIHAMGGEQDMRRMGGLWRKTPITYVTMWVGALSLSAIPFFSGYYSKDTILDAAWASSTPVGRYAWVLGTVGAFMTAFYISRVMFMTFHGEPRAGEEAMHHAHESPWVMLIPLIVLAIGAAFFGFLGYDFFVGDERVSFWRGSILVLPQYNSLAAIEGNPLLVRYMPLGVALIGIAIAYVLYVVDPRLPVRLAAQFRALYLFLLNKWYFDELYDWLFVRPAMTIGDGLWKSGDGAVIDGLGPDGVAAVTRDLARQASRLQTGYLYHYAFAMMIGLVAIVTWYLLPR